MTNSGDGFTLVIARTFLKDLQRLSRPDQLRVRHALENIRQAPFKGRKVSAAETGQYRWRIGDLRIRYDIEGDEIRILRVMKREDAYRKF